MLNWANQFNIFCFLDNHHYQFDAPVFECLMGVGASAQLSVNADGTAFDQLNAFYKQHPGWLFGHFGYDLKNELEQLYSANKDEVGFADLSFFVPETVLEIKENTVSIYSNSDAAEIYNQINSAGATLTKEKKISGPALKIEQSISRENYISSIQKIQAHILRGDCYEINFCQEFFATYPLDPVAAYLELAAVSPSPFAALYKTGEKYCISASPERYLKITGDTIISQPIKGTAFRDLKSAAADVASREQLRSSEKEKSENVMVVDLVRNDLSKVCKEGSVTVTELFGIYAFPQVHQMISTVEGKLKPDCNWINAVQATFPMGSMTGAPKKRVMELIETYEQSRRGLYSGAIGYVQPNGDVDFNVVIRSILYNAATNYVSFPAGSAITFYSDAEKEYEECLLKSSAIRHVLQSLAEAP